jgi:hypothetical protein
LLRQAGDFDRLDFIARKHLRGVAGIPDIDTERPQPFCAATRFAPLTSASNRSIS